MSVERTYIFEPHINKKIICKQKTFKGTFKSENQFFKTVSKVWYFINSFIYTVTEGLISGCHCKAAEVARNRTGVVVNGHLIIIQYNNQIFTELTCMRKSFKSHAAGKRTVANYCNYLALLSV